MNRRSFFGALAGFCLAPFAVEKKDTVLEKDTPLDLEPLGNSVSWGVSYPTQSNTITLSCPCHGEWEVKTTANNFYVPDRPHDRKTT
jgi:hypothetical protein